MTSSLISECHLSLCQHFASSIPYQLTGQERNAEMPKSEWGKMFVFKKAELDKYTSTRLAFLSTWSKFTIVTECID